MKNNMRSKTNTSDTSEYVPEKYRCRFTSRRGPRCNRRILNSADGLCATHSYIISKLESAESGEITEKLFDTTPYLQTREEVRSSLAQLYRLVAQRRVKRPDGALLAYIGSLVLQALPPSESGDAEISDETRAEEVRQTIETMFAGKNNYSVEAAPVNGPSHDTGPQG